MAPDRPSNFGEFVDREQSSGDPSRAMLLTMLDAMPFGEFMTTYLTVRETLRLAATHRRRPPLADRFLKGNHDRFFTT